MTDDPATLDDEAADPLMAVRRRAEARVITLLHDADFVATDHTPPRIVTLDDGGALLLTGRRRFANAQAVRATVGLYATLIYQIDTDGVPTPIAALSTLNVTAVAQALSRLGPCRDASDDTTG